jgi:hypothetical protein
MCIAVCVAVSETFPKFAEQPLNPRAKATLSTLATDEKNRQRFLTKFSHTGTVVLCVKHMQNGARESQIGYQQIGSTFNKIPPGNWPMGDRNTAS